MEKLAIKKFKIREMELIVVKNAALPLLLSIGGINLFFFFYRKFVEKKIPSNLSKQFLLFSRLITKMAVADATDNQWVNCFQEQGEALLGTR